MLHAAPPGSVGAAHQTGWMTTENFTAFMRHFIKCTKCSNGHPVLLILDNHDTHIAIETIYLAKNNGVVMRTLPLHCSHKLQPLDRSVYGPFKAFYNQAANAFMVNHPGQPITIHDISQLIGNAYPLAFTPKNITAGFRVSGICPFDRNVFSEDEFLSSYVTDRQHPTDTASSAGSILDISKYRDTCRSSIPILGGIAILASIEYRSSTGRYSILDTRYSSVLLGPPQSSSILLDPPRSSSILLDPPRSSSILLDPPRSSSILLDPPRYSVLDTRYLRTSKIDDDTRYSDRYSILNH